VKKDDKVTGKLEKKNVDTGSGLERVTTVLQGKTNVFETDLFEGLMAMAKTLSTEIRNQRIISDHMRSAVFMIGDGVLPANTDRGYVLRRLLRRLVLKTDGRKLDTGDIATLVDSVADKYESAYPEIKSKIGTIKQVIEEEVEKFRTTLEKGLKEFNKQVDPFVLFTTYGFPFELTKELAVEKGIEIDEEKFKADLKAHQDLSRAGSEQKFKGGLGDTSEMSVKYHTATHLLHQALRDVLGEHVQQKGSNITPERLRFDFVHPQKMTDEEKKKVEDIVNEKIKEDLPMNNVVLPKEEAEKVGALHFFGDKYGDDVSVYYIGTSLDTAYSKEFCGGPHVSNTGLLGTFKITKEEAVSSGVRRIKAILT
jgi:alanyl-tRNA synthetase